MNKKKLFAYLQNQSKEELIALLERCYCTLKAETIREIFDIFEDKYLITYPVDGAELLKKVHKFRDDSLLGKYLPPPKRKCLSR